MDEGTVQGSNLTCPAAITIDTITQDTLLCRRHEEVKNTLESCGLAFQVLVNFAAAGGERVSEIESISLMETAANQKKGINFQRGVQAFLLSDYSKPEGKQGST